MENRKTTVWFVVIFALLLSVSILKNIATAVIQSNNEDGVAKWLGRKLFPHV